MDKEYIVDVKKLFYKVSPKREKVWKIELDILMELDRICRKYDLRYFLDSGTLLGAVRHKGFIPWDDDIDLTMPRKDYDRLIEIASQELKSPYYLQHITTDPKYPGLHVKIRNTDTTAIIKSWLFTDVNQGIFIDIFPLEGLPNDPEKADELYKKQTTPDIADNAEYLKCAKDPDYWKTANYFDLEVLREKIRGLIKYLTIDGPVNPVDTHFEDEIIETKMNDAFYNDEGLENYKEKVQHYLKAHEDD